jgi:hypothetical protein
MTSPQHVSLPLRSLLDGLSGSLPECDPQNETDTTELLSRLGELRTTLSKESAPHLAEVSSLAILLMDHLSQSGLVGPKETMDVIDAIVALVRGALGLPRDEAPAKAAPTLGPRSTVPSLKLIEGQRLGELLVTLSMLTSDDVERALELQKMTGMLLGEALVEQGVLTKESVQAALRLQTTRRNRDQGLDPWSGTLR